MPDTKKPRKRSGRKYNKKKEKKEIKQQSNAQDKPKEEDVEYITALPDMNEWSEYKHVFDRFLGVEGTCSDCMLNIVRRRSGI